MQPIYLTLSEKEILAAALTRFIALMEVVQGAAKTRAAEDQRVARDLRYRLINTSHGDF